MFFLTFGSEVLKSPTATVEASLSSLKSMPASYVLGFFSVFMFITTLSFWLIDLFINIYQTVVLEKTLESPLDSKENKPVNPKGNQPWIFIGRTDAKAEAPILWPPDMKSRLTGKDPDAGKDWGHEEKGMTD